MRSWKHCWKTERACMMKNRWCLCADSWSEWKPWSRNSCASNSSKYDPESRHVVFDVEKCYCSLSFFGVIQDTQNSSCLKQFLDHHGLSLLWIFMVELSEAKGNSSNNTKLQLEVHPCCKPHTFACFLSVANFCVLLTDSENLGCAAHLY